jgi:PilZ domain
MKLRRARTQDRPELVLPERADPVTIVRPSGERVQARIAERDGDQLLVALMFRLERPLEKSRLDELQLEFTNRHGRIRLQGTVTLEDRELLRFGELHSLERIQEREYVRVQSTRPVLVITGSSQGTIQTFSVDLSGGGMLLAGPSTLKVGEQIQFRLTIAKDAPPITGVGTVVRTDTQGRRAICFDEIGEGEHRRLVRFVFECQRAERRRGLNSGAGGRRPASRAPRSSEDGGAAGRKSASQTTLPRSEGSGHGR